MFLHIHSFKYSYYIPTMKHLFMMARRMGGNTSRTHSIGFKKLSTGECDSLDGGSTKKALTENREGLLLYNDILLLVAFTATGCVLRREGLGPVVARTAEFACVHVSHGDGVGALLHLEETGMAIRTLEACCCVSFAVKYDFAGARGGKFHRLAGRHCECCHCHDERDDNDQGQYQTFIH
jgi:hypothetical protein